MGHPAGAVLRLQCMDGEEAHREAALHAPQSGDARAGRCAGAVAMEQFPRLCAGRERNGGGQCHVAVAVGRWPAVGMSVVPPRRAKPARLGHPLPTWATRLPLERDSVHVRTRWSMGIQERVQEIRRNSQRFRLDEAMQMITMKKICILITYVLFMHSFSADAQKDNYRSSWSPSVSLDELGRGDLNQAYDQLIDYLLPRQLSSDEANRCYLVMRYVPSDNHIHQINILFTPSKVISVWKFELPNGLELASSDEARSVAERTHVSAAKVKVPSATVSRLIDQSLNATLPIGLRQGAVLHGDKYELWGKCYLSQFESTITVPPNSPNPQAKWMDNVWTEIHHR